MKKIFFPLFLMLFLFAFSPQSFAKESVNYKTQNVKFSGGTRSVKAVFVDMNDKNIKVEAQYAKNQIGQTDDFTNIISQSKDADTEVLAAINGTFFNSYTDMKPAGTIQQDGRFYHIGSSGSVIAFSSDNKVAVENLRASIKGSINEDWGDAGSWYAWNINSYSSSKESIVIFDSGYGKNTPTHNRTSITVDGRKVTSIKKGQVPIPPGGYVIVLENASYIKKFHIGAKVDYIIETSTQTSSNATTSIDWSSMVTSIGAGPTLLKNGTILANGKLEGFTEDKINTNRGQRSFAGVTRDNMLIIGTVSNVNVKELAEICKNMGMLNAINLDGGASSALYHKGKVVTSPGRKLSNALVVTRMKTVPSRYSFNGKEVVSKNNAYVDSSSGELMVPLQETANKLFAEYSVKGNDITVKRYTNTISLKTGSKTISINGSDSLLKTPPVAKNNVYYIPVQVLTDTFGGKVIYDPVKKIYDITLNTYITIDLSREANRAFKEGNLDKAEKLYKQILSLDPSNGRQYYNLGLIYYQQKKNDEALKNYLEYLNYYPKDPLALTQTAWIYLGKNDTASAIRYFEKALEADPKNPDRWANLGSTNKLLSVKNYERALECYENALKYTTDSTKKAQYEKQIQDCKQKLGR